MAFKGLFIFQPTGLKTPPKDIDIIALPFHNCPDGMLTEGTIVTVFFNDGTLEGLELTVKGAPIYYVGWEIMTSLSNTDDLQEVYDYLMLPENGEVRAKRLFAYESFAFDF